jgi:putative DNA primase/helicase
MSQSNVISRDTPVETARLFRAQRRENMLKYQNDWLDWKAGAYEMIENDTIESEMLLWLEACKRNVAYEAVNAQSGEPETKFKQEPFNPKEADVQQVNNMLAHVFHVKAGEMKPPFFLDGGKGEHAGLDPANLISTQSGLLDITTRTEYPATPQFFTRTALPIAYDATAECPQFRTFLFQVLDDDGLVALMQQWFGHLITTDVTIQKLLYLQGSPRSGKGTIGRLLDALIGKDNVASHMLSDIATGFERESMMGKSLLKVSEVNAGNRQEAETAIAIINQITGEDRMHIRRKHKGALSADLRMHVVLMGNGYPDFGEHAAAFGDRANVIPFRISFVGREDDTLTAKLLAELPGILNFALDGLDDLRKTRKFKIVAASEEAKREILNSGNPVRAFVADLCELGPECETNKDELFKAYHHHCVFVIKAHPWSEPVFFKKLKEAFPGLQNTRPTIDGERENFIAGMRLRIAGPRTTVSKVFWLDCELTEMVGEDVILRDPITREPVEVIEGEFPGYDVGAPNAWAAGERAAERSK